MTKAVRRITAEKRAQIFKLAEVLYRFLPLDSRSRSTVTFTSIFRESRISEYLSGPENKLQALQQGFENLIRRHEKLPKSIIRKIVPAAIEYRRFKRTPLTHDEINSLCVHLEALGINMTDELRSVVIDDQLPAITIPPEKLKQELHQYNLNPIILAEPISLFDNGHYNEAVRKGFEKYEDKVREISGLGASGRDLMGKAFLNDSYLVTDGIKPDNKHDFNDGYKLLSMGAMSAIRNIFSHADEEKRTPEECFEMLLFLNWMLRYLKSE